MKLSLTTITNLIRKQWLVITLSALCISLCGISTFFIFEKKEAKIIVQKDDTALQMRIKKLEKALAEAIEQASQPRGTSNQPQSVEDLKALNQKIKLLQDQLTDAQDEAKKIKALNDEQAAAAKNSTPAQTTNGTSNTSSTTDTASPTNSSDKRLDDIENALNHASSNAEQQDNSITSQTNKDSQLSANQERPNENARPKRNLYDGFVINKKDSQRQTTHENTPQTLQECKTPEQVVQFADYKNAKDTTDNIRDQIGTVVQSLFATKVRP